MNRTTRLFQEDLLHDYLLDRKSRLTNEAENMSLDKILGVSEEELCQYLVSEYTLEVPRLIESEIVADEPNEVHFGPPPYTRGTSITIRVPFDGPGGLFRYKPSTCRLRDVLAEIKTQQLHLRYSQVAPNSEALKESYTHDIETIKANLEWSRNDIDAFNASLGNLAEQIVNKTKSKLLSGRGAVRDAVTALGIPIQRREETPRIFAIPKSRKRPHIEQPKPKREGHMAEPFLASNDYEDILNTIQSMALVIERSPRAFRDMGEEELRWLFVVPLNAIYEGEVTGETFNYQGKTDILIRHEDKNLFIAECKFWDGPKSLADAIDQLLGYTNWRAAKTAILLFSRRRNFSAVLEQIPKTVESHACYERTIDIAEETISRYEFHQPSDVNRKLRLTVMAFDIPI